MRWTTVAALAAALAAAGLLGWFAALVLGLTASSTTVTIVVRTLLVLAIVAIVTSRTVRRTPQAPRLLPAAALAGLIGCLLCPPSWTGRLLGGQLLVDAGVASAVLDTIVWTLVVVLVARATQPAPAEEERLPYA